MNVQGMQHGGQPQQVMDIIQSNAGQAQRTAQPNRGEEAKEVPGAYDADDAGKGMHINTKA